jgi:hypothetical protein
MRMSRECGNCGPGVNWLLAGLQRRRERTQAAIERGSVHHSSWFMRAWCWSPTAPGQTLGVPWSHVLGALSDRRKAGAPVALPILRSKRPGPVALDNARIYDIVAREGSLLLRD